MHITKLFFLVGSCVWTSINWIIYWGFDYTIPRQPDVHLQQSLRGSNGIRVQQIPTTTSLDKNEDTTVSTTNSDPSNVTPQKSPIISSAHPSIEGSSTRRKVRVLVGLFTADTEREVEYRRRHRALFELWDDQRICTLEHYMSTNDDNCEVIYTFVLGGAKVNSDVPTELVDDSRPILIEKPIHFQYSSDINAPDVTILNISENMNEGKSQTFLYYASQVTKDYNIDYVMKSDTDAILHFHQFVAFKDDQLPPSPYNKNMFIGALRDKIHWESYRKESSEEQFWFNEHENVHVYLAGQNYMMSQDLAVSVANEAKRIRTKSPATTTSTGNKQEATYLVGHEDHDISAMVYHGSSKTKPIKLVTIGKHQRYWEHPVKGDARWKRIWARETNRLNRKHTPLEIANP